MPVWKLYFGFQPKSLSLVQSTLCLLISLTGVSFDYSDVKVEDFSYGFN